MFVFGSSNKWTYFSYSASQRHWHTWKTMFKITFSTRELRCSFLNRRKKLHVPCSMFQTTRMKTRQKRIPGYLCVDCKLHGFRCLLSDRSKRRVYTPKLFANSLQVLYVSLFSRWVSQAISGFQNSNLFLFFYRLRSLKDKLFKLENSHFPSKFVLKVYVTSRWYIFDLFHNAFLNFTRPTCFHNFLKSGSFYKW